MDDTLYVELDLDPRSEPISGSVRPAKGTEHSFSGWLELATLLEMLRGMGGQGADDGFEGSERPPES